MTERSCVVEIVGIEVERRWRPMDGDFERSENWIDFPFLDVQTGLGLEGQW